MCTRCGTLLAHAVSLAPKEETKHSPAGSRRHGLARIRGQTKYENGANRGILPCLSQENLHLNTCLFSPCKSRLCRRCVTISEWCNCSRLLLFFSRLLLGAPRSEVSTARALKAAFAVSGHGRGRGNVPALCVRGSAAPWMAGIRISNRVDQVGLESRARDASVAIHEQRHSMDLSQKNKRHSMDNHQLSRVCACGERRGIGRSRALRHYVESAICLETLSLEQLESLFF
jgi:hypothetical protein